MGEPPSDSGRPHANTMEQGPVTTTSNGPVGGEGRTGKEKENTTVTKKF